MLGLHAELVHAAVNAEVVDLDAFITLNTLLHVLRNLAVVLLAVGFRVSVNVEGGFVLGADGHFALPVSFGQSLGHAGPDLLHLGVGIRLVGLLELAHDLDLLRFLRPLREDHLLDGVLQIVDEVLDAALLHFVPLDALSLLLRRLQALLVGLQRGDLIRLLDGLLLFLLHLLRLDQLLELHLFAQRAHQVVLDALEALRHLGGGVRSLLLTFHGHPCVVQRPLLGRHHGVQHRRLFGPQRHHFILALGLEQSYVFLPALHLVRHRFSVQRQSAQRLGPHAPFVDDFEAVDVGHVWFQLQLLQGARKKNVFEVVRGENAERGVVEHDSRRGSRRHLEAEQVVSDQLQVALLDYAWLLPLRSRRGSHGLYNQRQHHCVVFAGTHRRTSMQVARFGLYRLPLARLLVQTQDAHAYY